MLQVLEKSIDSMSDNIKDKIVIRHVPNFDPWNKKKN